MNRADPPPPAAVSLWRSVWTGVALLGAVTFFGSLLVPMGLLHLPHRWQSSLYRGFARTLLASMGVRIGAVSWHVHPDALDDKLVLIANHESHLDALVIVAALDQRSIRFIGKRQLFWFPVFGWAIGATGNIPVTRKNTQRDLARLSDPQARERDHDLLFFCEGTRSRDGNLGRFKKGAFAFAITQGRTILPMAVGGTRECLASHSLRPRPGAVTLVVGNPIRVDGLTLDDRDSLTSRARDVVRGLRQEALMLAASTRATV